MPGESRSPATTPPSVDRLKVTYTELTFGGDMRDISVSFAMIRQALEFRSQRDVEQGIIELKDAIESGLIKRGTDTRYRNAQIIDQ